MFTYQVTYGPRAPAPIENNWGGDFATREEANARAADLRWHGFEVFVNRFHPCRHPSRDSR